MHQHRDGAAFGTWPDVRQQSLHGTAPNALPAPGAHHEELPQINFVGIFAIERIRHRCVFLGKNDRTILSGTQPTIHAVLKLVDVHGVPVAFVMDELMVQLRQESDVCEGRKPVMHGLHTSLLAYGTTTGFTSRNDRLASIAS